MTTQSKTPITDAAKAKEDRWAERAREADMRGSHLESSDRRPPNGWETCLVLEEAAQGLRDAFSEDNLRRYHNACADAFSENLRASRRGTYLVHEMEKQFSEALARFDALKEGK